MSEDALTVGALTYAYPAIGRTSEPVIGPIDLTLARGSFVVVMGPSGCGKTTLLRLIAGYLKPLAGHVKMDGRAVERAGPDRTIITQHDTLFPWKSVLGNVAFGLKARGLRRKEQIARARRMLALIGMDRYEHFFPHQISGGMKQRVMLARACAIEPAILLMDEPFAALDWHSRRTLQDQLLGLWRDAGPTILTVTHSVDEALCLADRVVVMSGRPAVISEIIDVGLDRPRPRDAGESRAMSAIRLRITAALEHRSPFAAVALPPDERAADSAIYRRSRWASN